MKPMTEAHLAILRRHMVEVIGIHVDILSDELGRDALEERLNSALARVPRHLFVPSQLAPFAYHDTPLPIGFNKTLSQPFIASLMIELLTLRPEDRVLEVGTGLGYQAALLAELAREVWTVDVVEEFVAAAKLRLATLGYANVYLKVGDGSKGWPEHAPFDGIIVTAAAQSVPKALLEQLKPGGRLVIPIGPAEEQQLTLVHKDSAGAVSEKAILPVRFTELEIA